MKETKVAITARIPERLKKEVASFCEKNGLIIEKFVEESLITELRERRIGKAK